MSTPATGRRTEAVPRLALNPDEAAAAIGCSRDFFDKHVMHDLKVIRRGSKRLISVRELEKWLDKAGTYTF